MIIQSFSYHLFFQRYFPFVRKKAWSIFERHLNVFSSLTPLRSQSVLLEFTRGVLLTLEIEPCFSLLLLLSLWPSLRHRSHFQCISLASIESNYSFDEIAFGCIEEKKTSARLKRVAATAVYVLVNAYFFSFFSLLRRCLLFLFVRWEKVN